MSHEWREDVQSFDSYPPGDRWDRFNYKSDKTGGWTVRDGTPDFRVPNLVRCGCSRRWGSFCSPRGISGDLPLCRSEARADGEF